MAWKNTVNPYSIAALDLEAVMLSRLLEEELERRGVSLREAARQIGVSHTTLNMVKKNRPLEVNTAYLICQWLGVPITVAVEQGVSDSDMLISRIGALLTAAPELANILTVAAQEVEKGTLTSDDFKEIMQFAAFKIQQRRDQAIEQSRDTVSNRTGGGDTAG